MRFFTSANVGMISQSHPTSVTSKKYRVSRAATIGSSPVPSPRSLFEGGVRLAAEDLRAVPVRSQETINSDVIDGDRHIGPFEHQNEGLDDKTVTRLSTNRKWSVNPFIWLTRLAAKKEKGISRSKRYELPDHMLPSFSTGQDISSLILVSPKRNTDQTKEEDEKEEEIPNWAKPMLHVSSHAPLSGWISKLHRWDMDIFEVHNVTTTPLQLIGLEIFQYHDLIGSLNLDEQR